jgi:glutaredoxin
VKKFLFLIAVVVAAYTIHKRSAPMETIRAERHEDVVMYSLSTCGHCKRMAQQLRDEGIPFTERLIDRDPAANEELNKKLAKAGFPPQSYGTPIMDVKGRMLPNNPGIGRVKQYL